MTRLPYNATTPELSTFLHKPRNSPERKGKETGLSYFRHVLRASGLASALAPLGMCRHRTLPMSKVGQSPHIMARTQLCEWLGNTAKKNSQQLVQPTQTLGQRSAMAPDAWPCKQNCDPSAKNPKQRPYPHRTPHHLNHAAPRNATRSEE